jgi:hypothetical protein
LQCFVAANCSSFLRDGYCEYLANYRQQPISSNSFRTGQHQAFSTTPPPSNGQKEKCLTGNNSFAQCQRNFEENSAKVGTIRDSPDTPLSGRDFYRGSLIKNLRFSYAPVETTPPTHTHTHPPTHTAYSICNCHGINRSSLKYVVSFINFAEISFCTTYLVRQGQRLNLTEMLLKLPTFAIMTFTQIKLKLSLIMETKRGLTNFLTVRSPE